MAIDIKDCEEAGRANLIKLDSSGGAGSSRLSSDEEAFYALLSGDKSDIQEADAMPEDAAFEQLCHERTWLFVSRESGLEEVAHGKSLKVAPCFFLKKTLKG